MTNQKEPLKPAEDWRLAKLPSSARARIEATRSSGVCASLLSVNDFLSVKRAGLEAVGIAVGCRAERLGWGELGLGEVGCGYVPANLALNAGAANRPDFGRARRIAGAGAGEAYQQPWSPHPPGGAVSTGRLRPGANLVGSIAQQAGQTDVLNSALPGAGSVTPLVYSHGAASPLRSAVERMVEEALAMGADGVVDVRVVCEREDNEIWQCTATGTAVRTPAAWSRKGFSTTLSGADTAKLLHAGYAPVSVAIGMAMGIVHDVLRNTLGQSRSPQSVDNAVGSRLTRKFNARELHYLTSLVTASRAHARSQLSKAVVDSGAVGAILTSQMAVGLEEHTPSVGHHDVVATVTAIGCTVVALDGARDTTELLRPLPILPLRELKLSVAGLPAHRSPQPSR